MSPLGNNKHQMPSIKSSVCQVCSLSRMVYHDVVHVGVIQHLCVRPVQPGWAAKAMPLHSHVTKWSIVMWLREQGVMPKGRSIECKESGN